MNLKKVDYSLCLTFNNLIDFALHGITDADIKYSVANNIYLKIERQFRTITHIRWI